MVELQEKEKRETLVRNSTLWERTDEEKEVGRGEPLSSAKLMLAVPPEWTGADA